MRGPTSRMSVSSAAVPVPRRDAVPADPARGTPPGAASSRRSATFRLRTWARRRVVLSWPLRLGFRAAVQLSDIAVVVAAVALSGAVRWETAAFGAVALVLIRRSRLHRARITVSLLDDLPGFVVAVLGAVGTVTIAVLLVGWSAHLPRFVQVAGLTLLGFLGARAITYAVVRWARRTQLVSHPTLVIGSGAVGMRAAQVMREHPEYGMRPVGFLDDEPPGTPVERSAPLLGGVADLASVIARCRVSSVVVAFLNSPETNLVPTLRLCDQLGVEIFTVPRLHQVHSNSPDHEVLRGLPLIRLRRPAGRTPSWWLKQVFDVLAAAAGLVVACPVMAVCALGARVETGGVLFRQQRVGRDGHRFEILKFQSLRPADETEAATLWNVGEDARLGPWGRLMRRSSLDELPQLWNVLRGDMSLVGPRPERPHFVDVFAGENPDYGFRHRVPSGLTGWAQVNGLRGDTSILERAQFDNYYIENWSMWLDVKILLRTVGQVLGAGGG